MGSVIDGRFPGPARSGTKPTSHPEPIKSPLLMVVEPGREDQVRIGPMLKARREQLGYSLEQAKLATGIPISHLEALESMNIKAIPGGFAIGYAKTYARYLGQDADIVADRLRSESGYLSQSNEIEQEFEISPPKKPIPSVVWMALAALIALGLVVALSVIDGRKPAPTQAAQVTPANAKAANPGAQQSFAGRSLEIRAVRNAWIEARGPDGAVYVDRVLRAGETMSPQLGAGWRISVRDGSAFRVVIDDRPEIDLGLPEQPVYGWRVDAALLAPPPEAVPVADAEATTTPASTTGQVYGPSIN